MNEIPGGIKLLVRQMTWEATDVLSVVLTDRDGADLPRWTVGAHVDLVLGAMVRQYSLCGPPADRKSWKIAILWEPESRGGSRYVHEVLRPGAEVIVSSPRNNFPLVDAEEYLLFAGGIGVTPLLPMAAELARRGAEWHLLYGGRHRSSMAFVSELRAMGLKVEILPEDEVGLIPVKERISETSRRAVVYCCGPIGLIRAVEEACASSGRPSPHVERFAADPDHVQVIEELPRSAFFVVLARSKKRVLVPEDKSVAEVLADAGVWVPTSCTEGICGVCETEVLEGIPDHRDDYLSEERRASNTTVMLCVSRSKTPELTINL